LKSEYADGRNRSNPNQTSSSGNHLAAASFDVEILCRAKRSLIMSRDNSDSTQPTIVASKPSNRQFTQGGDPEYSQSTPPASNVTEDSEVNALTLMMLQAREGRA